MNSKEFFEELSCRLRREEKDVEQLLSSFTEIMTEKLLEGKVVALDGFGVFEVKKEKERIAFNPVSGQRLLVPPRLVLGFRPDAKLQRSLANE